MRKPKCYSRKMTKEQAREARFALIKNVPDAVFVVQFCPICTAYHVKRTGHLDPIA